MLGSLVGAIIYFGVEITFPFWYVLQVICSLHLHYSTKELGAQAKSMYNLCKTRVTTQVLHNYIARNQTLEKINLHEEGQPPFKVCQLKPQQPTLGKKPTRFLLFKNHLIRYRSQIYGLPFLLIFIC